MPPPRKFRLLVRTAQGPRLSSPPLTLVQAAEAACIYLHTQGVRVEVIPDTRSLRKQLARHDRAAWVSAPQVLTTAGIASETGTYLVWDRPFCEQKYEPPGRIEPTCKPKRLSPHRKRAAAAEALPRWVRAVCYGMGFVLFACCHPLLTLRLLASLAWRVVAGKGESC